jgi:hypothetical protein
LEVRGRELERWWLCRAPHTASGRCLMQYLSTTLASRERVGSMRAQWFMCLQLGAVAVMHACTLQLALAQHALKHALPRGLAEACRQRSTAQTHTHTNFLLHTNAAVPLQRDTLTQPPPAHGTLRCRCRETHSLTLQAKLNLANLIVVSDADGLDRAKGLYDEAVQGWTALKGAAVHSPYHSLCYRFTSPSRCFMSSGKDGLL